MPSVSRRFGASGERFERPSGQVDPALAAPVVLMVSGGADSTALLVLAATSALDIDDGRGRARIARERLHVLHVNHGLRGLDAEEDEEFVRDLAARYGMPCTIRRADVAALAAGAGDNVENAGRELRVSRYLQSEEAIERKKMRDAAMKGRKKGNKGNKGSKGSKRTQGEKGEKLC